MIINQQIPKPTHLDLPSATGSYVLILYLEKRQDIHIGRMGPCKFSRGYYAYTGSARGPGGLAARIRHHLKNKKHLHWHIDYLLRSAAVTNVWYSEDGQNHEHLWASTLQQLDGASIPLKGFGSSDCQCPSHLIQFDRKPPKISIRRLLESFPK